MAKVTRKPKVGLEIEMFVLNEEGSIANDAPKLLDTMKGTEFEPFVRPEISQAMIELGATPKPTVAETATEFLDVWEGVLETTEKQGYHLLALGAYPGKNEPRLNTKPWYRAKKSVLGEENVSKEASICGYHYHYTLPERIVKEEQIHVIARSHSKDTFLNQYNFLVASDPVALTVSQSSPLWQGEHVAKDARVLTYRDFALKDDKGMKGIHYYLSLFGALPGYEFTVEDLRVMADKRKTEWLKLLEKNRFKELIEIVNVPALKFMWGPLRVNKIGTFEYRGPDMNFPTYVFSLAELLTQALEAIEKQNLHVEPSDIGIDKPFLLEEDTIYLPPYSRVRYLEHMSAVRGLESDEIFQYCSRMMKLVEQISRKAKKSPLLKTVREMLRKRKTMSDHILELVRKNGYNLEELVPEDALRYVALYYAKELPKDIAECRKRCQ